MATHKLFEMLPSMPLISTALKEPSENLQTTDVASEGGTLSPHVEANANSIQAQKDTEMRRIDGFQSTSDSLETTTTMCSPLKQITPILKKGINKVPSTTKGGSSDQQDEKQSLRPIAPKPPIMVVISSDQTISTITHVQTVESALLSDLPGVSEHGHSEPLQITPETNQDSSYEQVVTSHSIERKDDAQSGDEKRESSINEKKDSEDELAALMLAATNTIKSSPKSRSAVAARKRSRQLRDIEATLSLLAPDTDDVKDEKAFGFAQAYFMKVTERLDGKDDVSYQEFLKTMNAFGHTILSVPELYWRVTSVLRQHSDLAEEFLAFLLPEQAMQCGKFMEHLMITKMRDFFRKLEIYFVKQPQQMRKIYSSLSTLSSQNNVTIKDVRTTILPLLKGNEYLIDNFVQLLPQERPPNSIMTDIEDLEFADPDSDPSGEDDWYETLQVPDQKDMYGGENCSCVCHTTGDEKFRTRAAHCVPCGTRFIHGNIFVQTGKALRPAKVVFDGEKSEVIKRLSVKKRPRNRIRRKPGNHVVVARRKVGKSVHMSSHDPTLSPKSSRTSKSRGSHLSHHKKTSTKISAASTLSKSSTSRSNRLAVNNSSLSKSHDESLQNSVDSSCKTDTTDNLSSSHSASSLSETYSQSGNHEHSPFFSLQPAFYQPSTSGMPNSHIPFIQKQNSDSTTMTLKDFSTSLSRVLRSRNVRITDFGNSDPIVERMDTSEPQHELIAPDFGKEKTSDSVNKNSCDSPSNMEVSEDSPPETAIWPITVCDTMMDEVDCESNPVTDSDGARLPSAGEPSHQSDVERGCNEWTREEDKIILEMFQMEIDTEQILIKISEQLPQRTINQIRARFQILMTLLQQIAFSKMKKEGADEDEDSQLF